MGHMGFEGAKPAVGGPGEKGGKHLLVQGTNPSHLQGEVMRTDCVTSSRMQAAAQSPSQGRGASGAPSGAARLEVPFCAGAGASREAWGGGQDSEQAPFLGQPCTPAAPLSPQVHMHTPAPMRDLGRGPCKPMVPPSPGVGPTGPSAPAVGEQTRGITRGTHPGPEVQAHPSAQAGLPAMDMTSQWGGGWRALGEAQCERPAQGGFPPRAERGPRGPPRCLPPRPHLGEKLHVLPRLFCKHKAPSPAPRPRAALRPSPPATTITQGQLRSQPPGGRGQGHKHSLPSTPHPPTPRQDSS